MAKNLSIYIDDATEEKMEKYEEINWSRVCREAIWSYLEKRMGEEGEFLKDIKSALVPIADSSDQKKKALKEDEIARFKKAWGEPDRVYDTPYEKPHILLRKNVRIKLQNEEFFLKILNKSEEESNLEYCKFKEQDWPEGIRLVAKTLSQRGLRLYQRDFLKDDYGNYLQDKNRYDHEKGRGCFATNGKDTLFIGYVQTGRR